MELYTKDKKKLNTGAEVPMLGFGTCGIPPGMVPKAVQTALEAGYRHIDTAAVYGNEAEVGQGILKFISECGVKREEIFITSKLWNNKHRPDDVEKALDESLGKLGLDNVDLYLMHWPVSFGPGDPLYTQNENFPKDNNDNFVIDTSTTIIDTWKAMVKLPKSGKVRLIGVANFSVSEIQQIIEKTGVTPAVLQIELHPYLPQNELVKYAKEKEIAVTAYWPLENPGQLGNNADNAKKGLVDDPVVQKIAKKYDVKPEQVLISYAIARGMCVIPRSVTPERIQSNFQVFKLDEEDLGKLNNLNEKNIRFIRPDWNKNFFDGQ